MSELSIERTNLFRKPSEAETAGSVAANNDNKAAETVGTVAWTQALQKDRLLHVETAGSIANDFNAKNNFNNAGFCALA